MAQKLGDVVFRRTGMGSAGNPGDDALIFAAQTMGRKVNWNQSKMEKELAEVQKVFYQYNQAETEHNGN